MRVVRANAEARDARGNLDPPLRGRGELGQPSDPHPSPTATNWQRLEGDLKPVGGPRTRDSVNPLLDFSVCPLALSWKRFADEVEGQLNSPMDNKGYFYLY